jgi:hypothetical protein
LGIKFPYEFWRDTNIYIFFLWPPNVHVHFTYKTHSFNWLSKSQFKSLKITVSSKYHLNQIWMRFKV